MASADAIPNSVEFIAGANLHPFILGIGLTTLRRLEATTYEAPKRLGGRAIRGVTAEDVAKVPAWVARRKGPPLPTDPSPEGRGGRRPRPAIAPPQISAMRESARYTPAPLARKLARSRGADPLPRLLTSGRRQPRHRPTRHPPPHRPSPPRGCTGSQSWHGTNDTENTPRESSAPSALASVDSRAPDSARPHLRPESGPPG
jgi:hypothetical protein